MKQGNRILIRGTNWIGDSVMSLAALREVRRLFPHHHRNPIKFSSQKIRLISTFLGTAKNLSDIAHQKDCILVASLVTPTQNDRLIAGFLQDLSQEANQGSLACSSHCQVSHADDRMFEPVLPQDSFLVEKDPKGNNQAVDFRE